MSPTISLSCSGARGGALLAGEDQQLPGQRRGAVDGAADLLEVLAALRPLRQVLDEELRVVADDGEEVVEVVRDAACEPPDALEAVDAMQPRLEVLALLLAAQSLGHVRRDEADAVDLAVLAPHRELQRAVDVAPVRVLHRLLDLERVPEAQHLAVVGVQRVGDLGGEDVVRRAPDRRVRVDAEQLVAAAVDDEVAALEVLDRDRDGRVVEDRLQAGLGGGGRAPGGLALDRGGQQVGERLQEADLVGGPDAALEPVGAEDAVALCGAADRDDGSEVDAVLAQDLRDRRLVGAAAQDRRAGHEGAGAHRRTRHGDRGVDHVDRPRDRSADEPAVALLGDQGAVDPERLDRDRGGAQQQLVERHVRQREAAEVEDRLAVLGLDLGAMADRGVGPVADDEDAEHAALGLEGLWVTSSSRWRPSLCRPATRTAEDSSRCSGASKKLAIRFAWPSGSGVSRAKPPPSSSSSG